MRTPEGWHKAWRGIRYCFKMPQTPKTRAHNDSELPSSRLAALACSAVAGRFATVLGASRLRLLRPHRRPYLSAYAASLTLRRSGLNFLFLRHPGFHGSRLRCCAAPPRQVAAPPPGYYIAPLRGSEFGFAYGSQSVLQIPIYSAGRLTIDSHKYTRGLTIRGTEVPRSDIPHAPLKLGLPASLNT